MFFLVAYDISSPKRLRRVARLMESYGTRVQRSVFECRLSPERLRVMVYQLKAVIKVRADRVHVYRKCVSCPDFDVDGAEASPASTREAGVFIF
jgi:CRISPR-associated protein Cas2